VTAWLSGGGVMMVTTAVPALMVMVARRVHDTGATGTTGATPYF